MSSREPERVAAVLIVLLALYLSFAQDARAQDTADRGIRVVSRNSRARPKEEDERARTFLEDELRRADAGDWAGALKAYDRALAIDPRFADALVAEGDAYMSSGKYKEAFAAYEKAVGVAPSNPDAYYSLGAAYNSMAQYGDAFKLFVQAVRLDPEFAEAHYGIGYAYLKLDNFKDALPYLRQAIRLKPDYAEARLALGETYLGLRDFKAAEAELKTLAGLDASSARDLDKEIRAASGVAQTSVAQTSAQPTSEAYVGSELSPTAEKPQAPKTEAPKSARLVSTLAATPKRVQTSRAKSGASESAAAPPQRRAAASQPAGATNSASTLAVELSFWDSIKNSNDPEEFAAYLRKYPEGQFAELARIRVRALAGKKGDAAVAGNEPKQPTPDSPTKPAPDPPLIITSEQPSKVTAEQPSKSAAEQPSQGVAEQPAKEQPLKEKGQPAEEKKQPANEPVETGGATTVEAATSLLRGLLPSRFSYKATTSGDGASPVTSEVSINIEPLEFGGCSAGWRDQNDTLSVSLSDLDPEGVTVVPRTRPGTTFSIEVWNVGIAATGGKGAITETKGDGSGAVNHYNGLDLQYEGKEKADGVARALRQAIKLCGGKP
ncbi:MAG: hypothetical protein DMF66_11655 [Acidobacteria bacterium]|nr:MAG: hypothetical protein DMF66_11655 [Acidobacteriota bacterium]